MTGEAREPKPHPALGLVNLLVYCAIAGTIGGFLARLWWPLDVLSNLRFQYLWLLLLLCVPLAWVGYRKHAVLAGACGLLNLACVAPLYFAATTGPVGETHLRLMAINVLTSNRDYGEVLTIIEQADPDILILLEVDLRWMKNLTAIRARLPHEHAAPREDNFGIAIYSREPLTDCRFVELAGTSVEAVVANARISGRDVRIIGAHAVPPVSGVLAATRNVQLRHLAQLAAESDGPTILAGDLNTSSWSPYFQDLLRDGRLTDTRRGHGLQHSHSTFYLLRMTIDHILVSRQVRTEARWVAPCAGSDHDAVVADLAF